jgi:hypothetical protein
MEVNTLAQHFFSMLLLGEHTQGRHFISLQIDPSNVAFPPILVTQVEYPRNLFVPLFP